MFTTVFGFKFFSLGYIYLFILACAHTRVHRPLPRHRGQRTTCRNQSPPSTVCTLGFGLTLPHFTQRCLTSLASAYGVWGIGLRPSCLCGKHFLTMLSLQPDRSAFWGWPCLVLVFWNSRHLSRATHSTEQARASFPRVLSTDSSFAQIGDRHHQAAVLSLLQQGIL